MKSIVTIKSASDGTRLTFSDLEGESFTALMENPLFSGRIVASTYHSGPPSLLFDEIAAEWRGWKKEKEWAALEDELRLTATSDHTGHITLRVVMRDSGHANGWRLDASLVLESGQLEALAQEVSKVFAK